MKLSVSALLSIYLLLAGWGSLLMAQPPAEPAFLDSLLGSNKSVSDNLTLLRKTASVKIYYTRVDRAPNGIPLTRVYYWQSDSLRYFSSEPVHLPLAMLALHKMAGYASKGIDRNSSMITETATEDQMPAYNDPRWPGGRPSLERYICNLLLLHDPSSFDRIYEFLGQAYIQQEFSRRGYSIRYLSRLEPESDEASRHTNPIVFYDEKTRPVFRQEASNNEKPYVLFPGEKLLSEKNILDPKSLHQFLTGLIYPERISAAERLDISADDRRFLLTNMSRLPWETKYPYHDSSSLNENAFFSALFPDKPDLRIFNTGGCMGRETTESVFVADTAKGVEFIMTASVRLGNESFKDAAFDFLSGLGDLIYSYETGRPRAIKPDLSPFILPYNSN